MLRRFYSELDTETQDVVDDALVGLVKNGSHITKVDLNLAYIIRVLRRRCTQQTEALFVDLVKSNANALVRREIIVAWIDWRHHHSLTDLKKRFKALSKWERRAFIVASYVLKDEGKFWRDHNRDSFDPGEEVVRAWLADRFQRNPDAPL